MRVKNNLPITMKGIIKVSFLQTPIHLLTLVQTSLICGAKLSLLSTDVPKNFVVGEWTELIPLIEIAGKLTWELLENTVKNYLETLRDNLLIWGLSTTLCNSVLILSARSERDLPLAYNVLSSAKLMNFKSSVQV